MKFFSPNPKLEILQDERTGDLVAQRTGETARALPLARAGYLLDREAWLIYDLVGIAHRAADRCLSRADALSALTRLALRPVTRSDVLAAVNAEIERRTEDRAAAEISADTEWTVYEEREGQIHCEERAIVCAEHDIPVDEFYAYLEARTASAPASVTADDIAPF